MGSVILFHWGKCYFNPQMHEMGSRGPKPQFCQPVVLENCQKAQIPCVSQFPWDKINIIILPEVDWICKKFWILFVFSLSPQRSKFGTKLTISCESSLLQAKLWYHMFPSMRNTWNLSFLAFFELNWLPKI